MRMKKKVTTKIPNRFSDYYVMMLSVIDVVILASSALSIVNLINGNSIINLFDLLRWIMTFILSICIAGRYILEQNITLRLDKDIIEKAKLIAAQNYTSVRA